MMFHILHAAALLLTLVGFSESAPTDESTRQRLKSRTLLGNNFGVPNINRTFDYVIVGGGNAGLTIAARLSEDPSTLVAVIEAGSFYEITNGNISQIPAYDIYWAGKDPNDVNPLVDWGFTTTPQAGAFNAVQHYPRGKTLGGSTARNYMAYQRGTVDSYQMWADAVGDQSYTFDSLLPYFEKSLDFTPPDINKRGVNATPEYDRPSLGPGGQPLSITFSNYAQAFSTWAQKGLEQIGIHPINGFTSGKLIGSSFLINTIDHATGARESSETAFLQPALGRPNLAVYGSTLARKVLFRGQTATGVQVDTQGKIYTLSAKKEVILSAGVFQSPQLLMVSGVGPVATLKQYNIPVVADRPGVGQNMWDHILFGPSYRVDVITGSALANPEFSQRAVDEFNDEQSGILSSAGSDFFGWEKVPQSLRSNFSSNVADELAKFPADWPEVEFLALAGFLGYQENYVRDTPTDGYNYATMAVALVAPLSRGTITISSDNTNDQPIINPNYLTHPGDQAVAIAAYKRVREFFATPAMQQIVIGPEYFPGPEVETDDEILDLIKKSFNSVWHASTTCAMGKPGDKNAVVDSHAKVMGVNGLRVVDASAFPFLPPGHPMATVYMLAEKIADDIRTGSQKQYQ